MQKLHETIYLFTNSFFMKRNIYANKYGSKLLELSEFVRM